MNTDPQHLIREAIMRAGQTDIRQTLGSDVSAQLRCAEVLAVIQNKLPTILGEQFRASGPAGESLDSARIRAQTTDAVLSALINFFWTQANEDNTWYGESSNATPAQERDLFHPY